MKYQLAKPFLFLIAVIMVVSLACGIGSSSDAPVAPAEDEPVEQAPVEESAPAESESVPTNTPEPMAEQYFTETFDADNGNWSTFIVDGELYTINDGVGKNNVAIDNGRYIFELEEEGQWVYAKYDPYEYENVRIEVVSDNRGVNNNNVSIICRYTPDVGWYEFNIANNGLYNIYYAEYREQSTKIRYNFIANGGSNKIRTGKEVNTYVASCEGRTLTLVINDFEAISIDDNQYILDSGNVGVAVSSFVALPVNVQIDSFTISEP